MRLPAFAFAIGLTAASGPAPAQNPWEDSATVEQAIARAIEDAMPSSQYAWSLNWSAFGIRGGRDIFWHLHDPEPYYRTPLPEGVHQRNGWLLVNGRSGDVTVCGDADVVSMMSIKVSDIWQGQSDVIEELAARGVMATLTGEIEARAWLDDDSEDWEFDPTAYRWDGRGRLEASRTWRLEKSGLDPVELSAGQYCTPPGTRHATMCWSRWTVLFRPDERVDGSEPCLPPRRPSDND